MASSTCLAMAGGSETVKVVLSRMVVILSHLVIVIKRPASLERGSTITLSCPENTSNNLRAPLRLQFRQQLLDAVLLLQSGQTVVEVVSGDLRLRLAYGLGMRDLALHAIERRGFRSVTHGEPRVAGLAHGAGAAMLRDQQIGLGLRFSQLLLQL